MGDPVDRRLRTMDEITIRIRHLYISPGHRYKGRHGKDPSPHGMEECSTIECVTDRGIRGDRYFDLEPGHKGQITFFADEVHRALGEELGGGPSSPEVFRRNVITDGVDLNRLIGRRFSLGGIEFEGVEEARPCYWMNRAFAEGAHEALKGRGGLRARILTDGELSRGDCSLSLQDRIP